jgi:hypothetical protein
MKELQTNMTIGLENYLVLDKCPNLRIHGKGGKVQCKGIDNLLNEIVEENFPNLGKDRSIHIEEAFRTPNKHEMKLFI